MMATNSSIEWCDATWNPVSGCTHAGPECDNCYAVPMSYRLEKMGQQKYAGLTVLNRKGDRHFNGVVRTDEKALSVPLSWKTPRMVFVNSMSDLFHRGIPFEFIDKVFAVMSLCPNHTFQILTKRPERMAEYLESRTIDDEIISDRLYEMLTRGELVRVKIKPEWQIRWGRGGLHCRWPLPNVWIGTSIGTRKALSRIVELNKCPAAVRFLSLEPLLEDLGQIDLAGIDWVIVGEESGHNRRAGNHDWSRSILAQCCAAGVKYFQKQLQINGKITTEINEFPEDLRVREFPPSPLT